MSHLFTKNLDRSKLSTDSFNIKTCTFTLGTLRKIFGLSFCVILSLKVMSKDSYLSMLMIYRGICWELFASESMVCIKHNCPRMAVQGNEYYG